MSISLWFEIYQYNISYVAFFVIIIISILILAIKSKKNGNFKEILKNNIIRVIILANFLAFIAIWLFYAISEVLDILISKEPLEFLDVFLILCIIFISLLSMFLFVCSNRLSKNKITIIVTLVIYFAVVFFVPVGYGEWHEHVFEKPETEQTDDNSTNKSVNNVNNNSMKSWVVKAQYEKIIEYKSYGNCYGITIYTATVSK